MHETKETSPLLERPEQATIDQEDERKGIGAEGKDTKDEGKEIPIISASDDREEEASNERKENIVDEGNEMKSKVEQESDEGDERDVEGNRRAQDTKKGETILNIRASMERMRSSVFFKDDTHGWLPGHLVERDEQNGIATVLFKDEEGNGDGKEKEVKIKLDINDLTQSILLQCVDDNGSTVVVEDMRDLPYSNEATILYNLKERYQNLRNPYTRTTSNVLVAINPYHWIDGLYSHQKRNEYSERIVWMNDSSLPPHLYEVSSMALKGIFNDDDVDQTIVVSGESGSGKFIKESIITNYRI